jgi:hypothetical protein
MSHLLILCLYVVNETSFMVNILLFGPAALPVMQTQTIPSHQSECFPPRSPFIEVIMSEPLRVALSPLPSVCYLLSTQLVVGQPTSSRRTSR